MPRKKKNTVLPSGTEAELTDKQRVFVFEYLTCWNATEAARRAGYSEESARQIAAENLSKPYIKAEIERRMAEKAMPADEVLARLADQARGSIGEFVGTDEGGMPNGFSLANNRPLHLVKKVSVTDKGWSFEMYDAQAALVHIGKHHGLFSNDSDDWQSALTKMGINAADFLAQLSEGFKQASS
jgi:phage terminase small subunit